MHFNTVHCSMWKTVHCKTTNYKLCTTNCNTNSAPSPFIGQLFPMNLLIVMIYFPSYIYHVTFLVLYFPYYISHVIFPILYFPSYISRCEPFGGKNSWRGFPIIRSAGHHLTFVTPDIDHFSSFFMRRQF